MKCIDLLIDEEMIITVLNFCLSSYSVVVEGERGNRPRIYSLEQLLQEAVRPFKKLFQ